MPPPQFRVFLSQAVAVKEDLRDAVARATARGQKDDAVRGARKILEGLTWLADELGESRMALNVLGELRVVIIGPIGAVFAVDRSRMEVQVGRVRLLGVLRGKSGSA